MDVKVIPGASVALQSAIKGLRGAESRVGWFPQAKYENGTPVAGVMMVQEFGSGARGIPPRPTMRPTAAAKQAEWARIGQNVGKRVVNGAAPPDAVVKALGLAAEADVRRAIIELRDPPLSILTLLARKHRKDTGRKVAGGKELGSIDRAGRAAGPPDVSGVSTKPLNDTGLALATLTSEVLSK